MILVVGCSGDLGGRVVRRLCSQGRQVRCLLRPGTSETGLPDRGVHVVRGDLTIPDSLPAACEGVEIVVATATAIGRRLAGARHPSIQEVDDSGMASLIGAAEQAAARRFVYVSTVGLDGPETPFVRAKIATEKRLSASSMQTVILRPDAFQEIHLAPLGRFDMAGGKVTVFGRGESRTRWVSTEDVAALVAAVALEPEPPDLIEFGGPEALSRNEAIAVAERLLGKKMKRQRIPRPVLRLGVRLLNRPNDGLASLFGLVLTRDLADTRWDDQPLRQRGIAAKSATQFLTEQVQALT